jgi:dihydroorotate dehydrogenase (fumarate)/dihydropyrimidine dehydrogenase (NAD+) subunit PreA
MKPDLSIEVCGVKFKNPIVVASATPSKDAKFMKRCVDAGCGGIIAKTVTDEVKMQHYVSPRFTVLHKKAWPHDFSNYSCEFYATYTPAEWAEEMKVATEYCHAHDVVMVGSISGTTMESWDKLAREMAATGVDMLELNMGCPHPRDLGYKSGQELGSSPEAAAEVLKVVVNAVDIPVFVKLTPEAVSPLEMAKMMQSAGASGVTAINRFPALDIDLESGRPLLHGSFAGTGGPWMRPIMLKWVAKIAREVDIPISATNGIWEWEDVAKAIMCGASTVQTCTALMYSSRGYRKIGDFLKGLESFMERKGYATINEMKGVTLPQILSWDVVDRETKAVSIVNAEKCTGCKICPNWCFYDAITLDEDGIATIDKNLCDGCGLCAALCPDDAIYMEGPKPIYLGDFR